MADNPLHVGGGPTIYQSYLVRMWQESESGLWRASAQAVHGGDVVHFATPQALCAFLLARIDTSQMDTGLQQGPAGNEM